MVPAPVADLLSPTVATYQVYGLVFLLGSFAVAALSDVKHLHAQREFVEVWFLAVAGVLAYDAYQVYQAGWVIPRLLAFKWSLVLTLVVLSHRRVGVLFSLARGDLAACAAASAFLPAALTLAFWVLLKLLSVVLAGALRRGRLQYPFMPIVAGATATLLAYAVLEPALPSMAAFPFP
jgi:hypothetical protein